MTISIKTRMTIKLGLLFSFTIYYWKIIPIADPIADIHIKIPAYAAFILPKYITKIVLEIEPRNYINAVETTAILGFIL